MASSSPVEILQRQPEGNVRGNQQPDENAPDAQEEDTDICLQKVVASNKWSLLVHGLTDSNLPLLCGILGKELPADTLTAKSQSFIKNGVTIEIHNGEHAECNKTSEHIDLLLVFVSINGQILDRKKVEETIAVVTAKHEAMIWKHSIFVFTGANAVVAELQLQGNTSARFETAMSIWGEEIKKYLQLAIENADGVAVDDVVNCIPAGSQEEPDLPHLYKKWLSVLWHACFFASKDDSMPAILKISQNRITYNDVTRRELTRKPFHEQIIYTPAINLAYMITLRPKVAGGSAVTGACIGAIIGAFALGIPTLGIGTKSGIVLGAVIGGGVGGGVVGAAIGIEAVSKKLKGLAEVDRNKTAARKRVEEASQLKLQLMEVLHHFPYISAKLQDWVKLKYLVEKPINCKIVVTGVIGEGVSTVAAALIGKESRPNGTDLYMQQIVPGKANLLVNDVKGFPVRGHLQKRAQEIVAFSRRNGIHLFIFCIPMTSIKDDFIYSPHIEALKRLTEEEPDILFNTVIALTHANEVGDNYTPSPDRSKKEFFNSELVRCRQKIGTELNKYIRLTEDEAAKVPIIPVGNIEPSIDLSKPEQHHYYYWLSKVLLHAMSVTKPDGLPALIKYNRRRINDCPDEYADEARIQHPAEENLEASEVNGNQNQEAPEENGDQNQEVDRRDPTTEAKRLLVEAQCSLFSGMGLKWYKNAFGETVGLIMGVNEDQDW